MVLVVVIHLMVQDGTVVTSVTTRRPLTTSALNTFGWTGTVLPNANVRDKSPASVPGPAAVPQHWRRLWQFHSGAQAWGRLAASAASIGSAASSTEQQSIQLTTATHAAGGRADRATRTSAATHRANAASHERASPPRQLHHRACRRRQFLLRRRHQSGVGETMPGATTHSSRVSDLRLRLQHWQERCTTRVTANCSDAFLPPSSPADGDLHVISHLRPATYGVCFVFTGTIAAADMSRHATCPTAYTSAA